MSRVSIVLPVYNGEKYIRESIESVLSQTFNDFELIVIDDNSTDLTPEILKEYKDSRITIYRNDVNKKLPGSLNEGFSHATGEYYTWSSDDNIYKPNAIEEMVKVLDDSRFGLVYADYEQIDSGGTVVGKSKMPNPSNMPYCNCIGACFMYKKEVATKVGEYDTNMFLAEDYDYWLRIWEQYEICHIDKELYQYRLHDKSLSATKKNDVLRQTSKLWKKHFDVLCVKINKKRDRRRFFDNIINMDPENDVVSVIKLSRKFDRWYWIHAYVLKFNRYINRMKSGIARRIRKNDGRVYNTHKI